MNKLGRRWCGGVLGVAVAGWLAGGSVAEAQSLRPATSSYQSGGSNNSGSSNSTGSSKNTSRPAVPKIVDNPNRGIVSPGSFYPGIGGNTLLPSAPSGNSPQSVIKLPGTAPYSGNNGSLPGYSNVTPSPYMNNMGNPFSPYSNPYTNPYANPYTNPYAMPYNPYVTPYSSPNPYATPYPYSNPLANPYLQQSAYNSLLQMQYLNAFNPYANPYLNPLYQGQGNLPNYNALDLTNRPLRGYQPSVMPLGDGLGGWGSSVNPGLGYRTPGY